MAEKNIMIHSKKKMAQALLQINRFSEAKPLYSQVCQIDNTYADAWFTLGVINGKLSNTVEAIEIKRRELNRRFLSRSDSRSSTNRRKRGSCHACS